MLVVMAALAEAFRRSVDLPPPVMSSTTVILLAAGAVVYFFAVALARRAGDGGCVRLWIVLVAVGMRAAMLWTPDLPLDDYQRYLWDGAVVADGHNPYAHSPDDVRLGRVDDPNLSELALMGSGLPERVNHPELRTIYPPVAEGLFAAAHFVWPYDRLGLQLVYAALEVLAVLMAASMLRRAGLPIALLAAYLWNPLLASEAYRGVHVDLAAGLLILAFVYYLSRHRPLWAAVALALATGVKLWPAVLVVFLLFTPRRRGKAIAATGLFAVLAGVMLAGYLIAAGGGEGSGLMSYAGQWRANPGVFGLAESALAGLLKPGALRLLLGGGALAITLTVGLLLARWSGDRPELLAAAVGLTGVCVLLMSPTLLTWYAIAVIPLAALAPRPAMLAWTLLLPLLYLPLRWVHPTASLAVVHGAVWALLAWSVVAMLRRPRPAEGLADV